MNLVLTEAMYKDDAYAALRGVFNKIELAFLELERRTPTLGEKGEICAGVGDGKLGVLAAPGSDALVLTSDSAEETGLKWS